MAIPSFFFEGADLLDLYRRNPDPLFAPADIRAAAEQIPFFNGRIQLSSWLGLPLPLPSIPVSFMGSPVTDLFPGTISEEACAAADIISDAERAAVRNGSWVLIVKDLPAGHILEPELAEQGFASIVHDPIWYREVPPSLAVFLAALSKGRRRGLEGRLRKFNRLVRVRIAREADLDFIKNSYDNVWRRAEMRLEQLSRDFFRAALFHPACNILIFEQIGTPFAFQLLWRKDDVWFDKYIGTDANLYREHSFYSMSLLHLIDIAPARGIKWYIAGQGSGKDKAGFGFKRVDVNLWIKPLALKRFSPFFIKRFAQMHNRRIYTSEGGSQ